MTRLALIAPDDPPDAFPPADQALTDPPGLLCAGGDLAPARLLAAYRRGIFPWFEPDQPILWWSPDPRAVLFTAEFHCSRSLRKTLRSDRYRVSMNRDFAGVIGGCASAPGRRETWVTPAMVAAYRELHQLGFAHSVETWEGERLVGGLYGISLGRMFFGESMFALTPDASKVAMACLVARLSRHECPLIDCQVPNPHLATLGSRQVPRREFLARLATLVDSPARSAWSDGPDEPYATRQLA